MEFTNNITKFDCISFIQPSNKHSLTRRDLFIVVLLLFQNYNTETKSKPPFE